MNIAVIGTGYVGLVAGACFAETGNQVICVDVDEKKVSKLKNGEIPIYEPGLEQIVERGIKEKRLHFTTSTEEAVQASDIIFMAVGTPPLPSGEPDLKYLKAASESIGKAMNAKKIVVNKSTVPIGSHITVREWIESQSSFPVEVVSNPEFLKEGTAVEDFLKPDRVIVGSETEEAFLALKELYTPFVKQGNPILHMDPVSAEMTKYACNAFLATRISFMNELSRLSEKVGGNIDQVRKGMSTDVRIGKHFLYAGAGYGGSCFPKDVQALMSTGKKYDLELEVVTATENANAKQKRVLFDKISKHFQGSLQNKKIAIWGLAFKPNTDDIREAPSLVLIDLLLQAGAKVKVFDPVALENVKELYKEKIEYADHSYSTLDGADALAIVTEWNEFKFPDFEKCKSLLKEKVIFDGRNIYEPMKMKKLGFQYYGMGRSV